MINTDLLIVTVPVTDTGGKPLQAPAVLKGVAEKNGYSARTMDLNHEFHKLSKTNKKEYDSLKNYFMLGTMLDIKDYKLVDRYIDKVANEVLEQFQPKYLAVSVFTYLCQKFSELFAQKIKDKNPKIKIIFGGMGLQSQGIKSDFEWPEKLKSANTIDHYIASEGEVALVRLLKHGKGPGIDNPDWEQQKELDSLVYPDYSDYDFNEYGTKTLMITGSRGCVRKCSFCDIHVHWKQFVFRSGRSIADEMISQSQKYGIFRFQFTDSLINGSMKAYREFVEIMSDYNKNHPAKITWRGQMIVRGIRSMTKNDWVLTRESGAVSFDIGIESGSESVRDHMKKRFSNLDMDEFIEQAFINKVPCRLLLIVGYLNETREDFQQTLNMLKKYKKYQSMIPEVFPGTTMSILPGTTVWEDHKNDLSLNGGENFWTYAKNPTLDFRERLKRRIVLAEECRKLGYKIDEENGMKLMDFLWKIQIQKQQQSITDIETNVLSDQKYS